MLCAVTWLSVSRTGFYGSGSGQHSHPLTPCTQAAFHVGPGWAPVGQGWAPNGPRMGLTGAHLGMLLGYPDTIINIYIYDCLCWFHHIFLGLSYPPIFQPHTDFPSNMRCSPSITQNSLKIPQTFDILSSQNVT